MMPTSCKSGEKKKITRSWLGNGGIRRVILRCHNQGHAEGRFLFFLRSDARKVGALKSLTLNFPSIKMRQPVSWNRNFFWKTRKQGQARYLH